MRLFGLVTLLFVGVSTLVEAQQPTKVPRIGYLSAVDAASDSARAEGLRLALRELGYIEGQNIAIEYRYAEGKFDRAPGLAAELVRLNVDIIVVARRAHMDPGGQECDRDNSHRYGGAVGRSCRGRPS
jgi:putative tryptophan/tyrosine transport system substrate-binding protein